MKLRDYQETTQERLRELYEAGQTRLMVRFATGLGKTATAAFLPERFPELARHGLLFLSHRREILFSAYQKFKERYKGKAWVGIEMGERHATGQEDFLFVSVDSLGRLDSERIRKYARRRFGIIVADEGHHVTKEGTWDNILNYFGVGSDKSQAYTFPGGTRPLSVFLTATPQRADGQSLEPFVDAVAADYDIRFGQREGWLTSIVLYNAYAEGRDPDEFTPEMGVDFLARTVRDYAKESRTLVFAKNLAESEQLAATLNLHKIARAAHIDHKTEDTDRTEWLRRFSLPYGHEQAIDVLTNRLVLTEGYDNPMIQTIIDNAPTESAALYIQKVGRGLRTSPDAAVDKYKTAAQRREAIRRSEKPFLTYVTAFPVQHGLDMPAAIYGVPAGSVKSGVNIETIIDVLEYEDTVIPEAPTRPLADIESMDVALKRQDIWTQTVYNETIRGLTQLRWIRTGDDWAAIRLPFHPYSTNPIDKVPTIILWARVPDRDDQYQLHVIREGGWVAEKGFAVKAAVKTRASFAPTLDDAISWTDKSLKKNAPEAYSVMQRHDDIPASDSQINYLKSKKIEAKWELLTSETAEILKDDHRIRTKLDELGIQT